MIWLQALLSDVAIGCMTWPKSCIITWQKYHPREISDGTVHAKAVIADRNKAFLTSANLTGHALNKNIEAGPFLTGGVIPNQIFSHMIALIDTKVLNLVSGDAIRGK